MLTRSEEFRPYGGRSRHKLLTATRMDSPRKPSRNSLPRRILRIYWQEYWDFFWRLLQTSSIRCTSRTCLLASPSGRLLSSFLGCLVTLARSLEACGDSRARCADKSHECGIFGLRSQSRSLSTTTCSCRVSRARGTSSSLPEPFGRLSPGRPDSLLQPPRPPVMLGCTSHSLGLCRMKFTQRMTSSLVCPRTSITS